VDKVKVIFEAGATSREKHPSSREVYKFFEQPSAITFRSGQSDCINLNARFLAEFPNFPESVAAAVVFAVGY
jgi:hypothetical protein